MRRNSSIAGRQIAELGGSVESFDRNTSAESREAALCRRIRAATVGRAGTSTPSSHCEEPGCGPLASRACKSAKWRAMRKNWPALRTNEEAARFVAEADLTENEFSTMVPGSSA